MLEETAKTKWCPMVRMGAPSISSINRNSDDITSHAFCLGSNCMMWRPEVPASSSLAERHKNPRGSCGLTFSPIEVSVYDRGHGRD